jgi:hypothetical protein
MGKHKGPWYQKHWANLTNALADDAEFQHLFARSITKEGINTAASYLWDRLKSLSATPLQMGESRELFSDFITFCKCTDNTGSIPESLKQLINDRDIAVRTQRAEHQNLISVAGLDWKSKKQIDRWDMRLREVPIHHLPQLAVAYPRAGTWVAETSEIRKLWKERLMVSKLYYE